MLAEVCPAVRWTGEPCWRRIHTDPVHVTQQHQPFMSSTEDWRNLDLSGEDPERDAPAALRTQPVSGE
jgi:hypothetical protein